MLHCIGIDVGWIPCDLKTVKTRNFGVVKFGRPFTYVSRVIIGKR